MRRNYFTDAVVVVTDIAFLNTIYFTVSLQKTPFLVDYLPWFLCGLCGYAANVLFFRKPRTVPAVFGLNASLYLAEAGVLLYLSRDRIGVGFCLMLASGLLVTVSRESYVVLHPPSPQQRLLYTESAFLLTLWLFLVQSGSALAPPSYNAVMFAILLLNMASLIQYRVSDESSLRLSRGWALLLFGGISASLAFLLFLLSDLFSGALRAMTRGILHYAGSALKAVLTLLGDVIIFLLSLLPQPEVDSDLAPPPLSLPEKIAGEAQTNPAVIRFLCICGVILAAAAAAIFLFRLRKTRMPVIAAGDRFKQEKAASGKAGFWKRLFQRALFKARFFLLSVLNRSTPAGLLYQLEQFGKFYRVPRRTGETSHEYISRICLLFPAFSQTEFLALFNKLADALDGAYFGGGQAGSVVACLTPEEISHLRKQIRHQK